MNFLFCISLVWRDWIFSEQHCWSWRDWIFHKILLGVDIEFSENIFSSAEIENSIKACSGCREIEKFRKVFLGCAEIEHFMKAFSGCERFHISQTLFWMWRFNLSRKYFVGWAEMECFRKGFAKCWMFWKTFSVEIWTFQKSISWQFWVWKD